MAENYGHYTIIQGSGSGSGLQGLGLRLRVYGLILSWESGLELV